MVVYYLVILCVVGLGTANREIPSYIHICRRNDPGVARCIRDSVELLRPKLKVGIPELGVPALEPLVIDEIDVFGGGADTAATPTSFKVILKNVKVRGASDFKITKIKANVDKHTYRVGVKFDKMHLDGDYDVDARIILPLKGTGKFAIDISDIDGQALLKADIINYNGHRQYNFNTIDLKVKVADYKLDLDNLFSGDEAVGRAINNLVQDNKAEIIQRVLPIIESKTSEILLQAANKITEDLDYDEVFPEK